MLRYAVSEHNSPICKAPVHLRKQLWPRCASLIALKQFVRLICNDGDKAECHDPSGGKTLAVSGNFKRHCQSTMSASCQE